MSLATVSCNSRSPATSPDIRFKLAKQFARGLVPVAGLRQRHRPSRCNRCNDLIRAGIQTEPSKPTCAVCHVARLLEQGQTVRLESCRVVCQGRRVKWQWVGGVIAALVLVGCASSSSVVLPATSVRAVKVALLPLDGPLGDQAVDLLSQEFAAKGIAVVERGRVVPLLALDTDLSSSSPDAVQNYGRLGDTLGVRYLFAGTVSADQGPLYSYRHVNMTLRLIDVRTGQTRWIGKYGNALWSSAISTQGDLQRGARDLVQEFVRAGGDKLLVD